MNLNAYVVYRWFSFAFVKLVYVGKLRTMFSATLEVKQTGDFASTSTLPMDVSSLKSVDEKISEPYL